MAEYARRESSLGRCEAVASVYGGEEGVGMGRAEISGAGCEMTNEVAIGGVRDEGVQEGKNAAITPKHIRGPVRLSMEPDAPSQQMSVPGDMEIRESTAELGKALEAWEADTEMLSPEAEGIDVGIPSDHEQPSAAKHESKDGQENRPCAEQLHEAAIIHPPEPPAVPLPEPSSSGSTQDAEHSDKTASTKLANHTSNHVESRAFNPVTNPSHEDASPSTSLSTRDLMGKEIYIPSDDSEGLLLVGQPSRAPSPAPVTPALATRAEALDDGVVKRDEQPQTSDEEFHDGSDDQQERSSSRTLSASASDTTYNAIGTRGVKSEHHGAGMDQGEGDMVGSAHDVVDYDMQEHLSDVATCSSSQLSDTDVHVPPYERILHRSARNVMSIRELAALGSTLAPGMYLGAPTEVDQGAGKRKCKAASSIAGGMVYFREGELIDDDDEEKEEEVEVKGVKKRRRKDSVPRVGRRNRHRKMHEAEQEEAKVGEEEKVGKEEGEEHVMVDGWKGGKSKWAAAKRTKITPRPAAEGGKRYRRGGTGSRASSIAKTSDTEEVKPGAKNTHPSSRLSTPSVATPTTARNKFGFTPPKTRSRASLASTPSGKTAGKERMTRGAAAKEAKEKNIGKRLRSGDV